jgi:hypothetical protein
MPPRSSTSPRVAPRSSGRPSGSGGKTRSFGGNGRAWRLRSRREMGPGICLPGPKCDARAVTSYFRSKVATVKVVLPIVAFTV